MRNFCVLSKTLHSLFMHLLKNFYFISCYYYYCVHPYMHGVLFPHYMCCDERFLGFYTFYTFYITSFGVISIKYICSVFGRFLYTTVKVASLSCTCWLTPYICIMTLYCLLLLSVGEDPELSGCHLVIYLASSHCFFWQEKLLYLQFHGDYPCFFHWISHHKTFCFYNRFSIFRLSV